MISYRLRCAAGHGFEGWFRSGDAFDADRAAGRLECPVCGGRDVEKGIMAPAIARSGAKAEEGHAAPPVPPSRPQAMMTAPPAERLGRMIAMARALRRHVETHFEDVGPRFPEEARAIHDGAAETRGIYGQATPEEARALAEDGIEVMPMPNVPKLDG